MTLVDTNVLLDVLTNDSRWADWSIVNLRIQATQATLVINEVTYAELAGHVRTESELSEAIRELNVRLERTPPSALFLAGVVFRRYRRAAGTTK